MLSKMVTILSYTGAVFVVILALMTGVDVVGRYAFNLPIHGGVDLTEFVLVVIVACGIAITTAEDNHISVDSVYEKLPASGKKILLIFVTVTSTFILIIFLWQGIVGTMDTLEAAEISNMLEIPIFPFKIILSFGFLLSLIFSINRLIRLFFTKQS